jgi:hypothetical protein
MAVLYPGYRVVEEPCMTFEGGGNGGKDAILLMLWRQNEGETDKNFSPKDGPLNSLHAAITPGIPPL